MEHGHDTAVVARFSNLTEAEEGVQAVLAAHVPPDHVSVLGPADGELEEHALRYENGVLPGAVAGGVWGTVAALLGAAVAVGPIGAVAAPVAVAAAGLTGGSVAGGLIGLAWWRQTIEARSDLFDDEADAFWGAVQHPTLAHRAAEALEEAGAATVQRLSAAV